MKQRIHVPELIDLGPPHYTPEEYHDCLRQLGRIGRYLGGNRATLKLFKTLDAPPTSILDVGCGGGFFTLQLAKTYPKAHVEGIDISEEAISYANQLLAEHQQKNGVSNLTFTLPKTPELNSPPNSYDVVTSTLVCHHLTDAQIIQFLQKSVAVAKEAVIINDLHRHPLAYSSFSFIAPLFFQNRLIVHDGLLSIRKSFTRSDWESLLSQAEIPSHAYSLSWHWPFRWGLVIFPKKL